jgi:hypothetical protein
LPQGLGEAREEAAGFGEVLQLGARGQAQRLGAAPVELGEVAASLGSDDLCTERTAVV